jgi:branched-chain amino acid transport system ATP-binding protein
MGRAGGDRGVQLQVCELSKSFGGVRAVNRVEMTVDRGSIVSVIGPNGAGKTTLLNMISGFYHPDEGSIRFGGTDITRLAPHRIAALGVARTFQNIALFRGLTVLDNLMLGRHVHMHTGVLSAMLHAGRCRREEVAHRGAVEDVIDFLEIEPLRKRVAGALPFGLQKRVELGRALAAHPKLLLLDEPMGGMNVEEKEDMARFILDVNEEWGTTIVLIEHDMSVVMDLSQRVVVMDLGERIAEGSPAEVRANPAVVKAYLGDRLEPGGGR